MTRAEPIEQRIADKFHHYCALALIWLFFCAFATGCGLFPAKFQPKVPTAEYVAGLTVQTVAFGAVYADVMCEKTARDNYGAAKEMGDGAGMDRAIALVEGCDKNYDVARKALLAAALAVDGWKDASDHSSVVCALTEATTALSLIVQALRDAGVVTFPREVTMALAAVSVLAEMVEAKQCLLPARDGGVK